MDTPADKPVNRRGVGQVDIPGWYIENKLVGFYKYYENMLREGISYDKKIWNEHGLQWLKKLRHEKLNDFIKLYEMLKQQEKED